MNLGAMMPESVRETWRLRALGFMKIPVIFFVSPKVLEITDQRCEIRIPLNRRTRNHLGSMYFGALAVGADVAGGLIAWRLIERKAKGSVSLVFKDFQAEFLKRAEGDVHFSCEDGQSIQELLKRAIETGERVHAPVQVIATVPSKLGKEPVARLNLTISLKKRDLER